MRESKVIAFTTTQRAEIVSSRLKSAAGTTSEIDYAQEVGNTPQDSDGDSLPDYDESHFHSTSLSQTDTDGDSIDGGTELSHWKDLDAQSWDNDIDGDGRSNLVDWDTEGDGYEDGTEHTARRLTRTEATPWIRTMTSPPRPGT